MSAEDFLVEHRLRQSVQTIKTESHVDRIESYEYARGWRNAQHRPPLIKRARSRTARASRQRIIIPDGATTSIAQALDDDASGAASLISLNKTGTGRFEIRFALASQ